MSMRAWGPLGTPRRSARQARAALAVGVGALAAVWALGTLAFASGAGAGSTAPSGAGQASAAGAALTTPTGAGTRTLMGAGAAVPTGSGSATSAGTEATTPTSGVPAASTYASITPVIAPDRRRARAALTITIRYYGGEAGVPTPLRRAVLMLPAGLNLEVPQLRSCSATTLLHQGGSGCPAHSVIGHGYALVEGSLGAQNVTEHVTMRAFLGPPRNLQPTFEILAQGSTPIGAQMLLTATATTADAPYGEALEMLVPTIATVPNEPDASVIAFSLTIGAAGPHAAATVRVPARCPAGGLPFGAEFTYINGSSSRALTRVPCPR